MEQSFLFEAPNYTIKRLPVISTPGIGIQGKNYHSVRDLTLGLIKEIFWKVHAKSLIKKGLFDCYYSKHLRVLPKPPLRLMIHNQYEQCGVTPHLSTEQNLLKKILRKDKW